MNDSQFSSYMNSQWTIAIGTILLAIIAIWGDIIRKRWFGPKLHLALKNPKGELFPWGDGVRSWYYHLRVWNKRRLTPAKNVRVVVKGLWNKGPDGTIPITLSGPFQLEWQFQGLNPQFQTIGAESTCDLGYLRKDEPFKLKTMISHPSYDFTIREGESRIVDIIALSDEAESNELKLEITWDGEWIADSDKMLKHLVIKPISRP